MGLHIYASNTVNVEVLTVDSTTFTSKVGYVVSCWASGAELKRALQVSGLPQYGAVMSFYGDTAKHIIGNWLN